MKWPIPTDWDGETWQCYSIQWPDSEMWRGILYGLLHSLTRGRSWDKTTGVIKAAQANGVAVFEANNPLSVCGAECDERITLLLRLFADFLGCCVSVPSIPQDITLEFIIDLYSACLREACLNMCGGSGDCCEGEDEEMAVQNIKCEGGKLYAYMCCEWVEVCDLAAMLGESIPDTVPEPDPPPADPSCFKSGAFAEHFTPWLIDFNAIVQSNLIYSNSVIRDMIVATYPANQWQWYPTINAIQICKWYPATIADMLGNTGLEGILKCEIYEKLLEHSSPADLANWQLTLEQMQYIQSYVAGGLPFDPHANAYVGQFLQALAFAYTQTTLASYDPADYDCSTCSGAEMSPQSAVTASGWFLTQGYPGAGPQSASGESYNNVCLSDLPDFPFNCWGVAFNLVATSQQLWPGGAGSTGCTGQGISGGGSWSAPQYIARVHSDIWDELSAVAGHSYNRSDDGHFNSNNVSLPDDEDGDDFLLAMRGDFNTAVVNVEATDIRFICNVNNLGV